MELDVNHDNEADWETCPVELLINIFEYLDSKDLLACMGVNKRWRCIVGDWGEKYNKWWPLVKNKIPNGGITFRQRSTLSYRELYLNHQMWYSLHNPQVDLKQIYSLKEILNLHVYKDHLIAVYKDGVKFYNTKNGILSKEISGPYLDYQETDYLIAKVTQQQGEKHILLNSKCHDESYECLGFHIFIIQQDKCCLITDKNPAQCVLTLDCTSNGFRMRKLARYYGNSRVLCSLHMYEEDTYIYTSKGEVFHVNLSPLYVRRVCGLYVPNPPGALSARTETFMTMFHRHSVLYGVKSTDKQGFISDVNDKCPDQQVVLCEGVTCATEHGDFLVFGFEDGKVAVIAVSELRNHLDRNALEPFFQFHIQKLTPMRVPEAVTHIEVYEDEGCHHIFAATNSNLYQFVISDADYTKVMP